MAYRKPEFVTKEVATGYKKKPAVNVNLLNARPTMILE